MEKKICLKCKEEKPLTHFYKTAFGGRINECASCKTEYHRKYRENNRPRVRELSNLSKARFKAKKAEKEGIPKKCAKRDCDELAVDYEGVTKFCKSHAIDYIFSIPDV